MIFSPNLIGQHEFEFEFAASTRRAVGVLRVNPRYIALRDYDNFHFLPRLHHHLLAPISEPVP